MDALRVALFVVLAALAAVGGWFLYTTQVHHGGILASFTAAWKVSGSSPLLIGSSDDRFAYAGGTAVQTASGAAQILLDSSGAGTIDVTLQVPVGAMLLTSDDQELRLTAQVSETPWQDVDVNGATGRAEPRLPTTRATLGGSAPFRVLNGANLVSEGATLQGIWIVADAVRREDGSIRQDGLIFSPLLRDKRGFSDRSRTEFTLLVYGAEEETTGARSVLLHVVFREVQFLRVPEEVTRP